MAFFCEDIREEASGQQTAVGILPDILNLPPPPTSGTANARPRLPKLAVYFRIQFEVDEVVPPLTLKLIFPNNHEINLGTIDQGMIDRSKREASDGGISRSGLRFTAVFQNFRIEEFGTLSAVVEMGSDRSVAGVLHFRVLPNDSTASGPPS